MNESGLNDQSGANQNERNAAGQAVSPGARLAAYREERGWTVQQVANQLNLAPRQIAALESDDYPALPGMPIVRGFIRAYAKLLKIDPAPLLADVGGAPSQESIAPMSTLATPFSETRLPTMMDRPGLSSKWIVGLLLAILLGVAIWAARRTSEFSTLSHTTTSQVKTDLKMLEGDAAVAAKSTQSGPATDSAAPSAVEAEPPQPAVSVAAPAPAPGAASAANAGKDVQPAPVAAPSAAAATADATPVAPDANTARAAGKDALLLNAHEDSWVEIRRVRDKGVLLSRVLKAGETERVDISEPVSVVIGNAAGIDASLRGAPLEIKGDAQTNVARLTLK